MLKYMIVLVWMRPKFNETYTNYLEIEIPDK